MRNAFPIYGTDYTTCIGGCNPMFNEVLNIKNENIKSSVNDSGYRSTFDGIIVPNSSSIRSSGTRPFSNTENKKNLSESNASIGFVRNQNNNRNREGSRNIQQQNISWNNTNTSFDDLRLSENEQSKIWGNIDDNAIIMCKCHENAIQLTVRKDGPNHGIYVLDVYERFLIKYSLS